MALSKGYIATSLDYHMSEEEYEAYQALQGKPSPESIERFNPGNLKFRDQKDSTGKDEQGFAIFPSEEAGWQALYNQIDKDKGRNLTLKNFINKYAPPVENDTTAYLKNVQKWLNVGKNKKIKKICEKMDAETQESIKVLINHLAQKKITFL